jgi:hypothetical protein
MGGWESNVKPTRTISGIIVLSTVLLCAWFCLVFLWQGWPNFPNDHGGDPNASHEPWLKIISKEFIQLPKDAQYGQMKRRPNNVSEGHGSHDPWLKNISKEIIQLPKDALSRIQVKTQYGWQNMSSENRSDSAADWQYSHASNASTGKMTCLTIVERHLARSRSIKGDARKTGIISGNDDSKPGCVPFYIYEDMLDYWSKACATPESPPHKNHNAEYHFLLQAMSSPCRVLDPDSAVLFVVPALIMNSGRQGCGSHEDNMQFLGRALSASAYFQRHKGRAHVLVNTDWMMVNEEYAVPDELRSINVAVSEKKWALNEKSGDTLGHNACHGKFRCCIVAPYTVPPWPTAISTIRAAPRSTHCDSPPCAHQVAQCMQKSKVTRKWIDVSYESFMARKYSFFFIGQTQKNTYRARQARP